MTDDELIRQLEQLFDNKISTLNSRLDVVAAHVVAVGDDVTAIKDIATEHSSKLDRLERRLNRDLDRLDDHGTRIQRLEAKTDHLSTRRK